MAGTSIILWATLPSMTKSILSDFPSMTLLYYSSVLASAALLVFLLATGRIRNIRTYSKRYLLCLTGLGLLGEFLYSALYYKGLSLISATDACILNYLWPITAVIFSCIFLKEKLTLRKVSAILLSFCGVILIISKGKSFSGFAVTDLTGCGMCLLLWTF
ncbi:MAG TPA: hypothetical protein DEP00_00370 [Lachnospiraceae bacterium]|nr:hypothetical protein [Lachnospiraceae bacterium]